MHENRETSRVPAGKANNHNPDTHAQEESDRAVVPMKQSNKGSSKEGTAEVVEGRAGAKEKSFGLNSTSKWLIAWRKISAWPLLSLAKFVKKQALTRQTIALFAAH